MKEYARVISGVVLDLRVIVGLCGIILSVLAHELFHIMIHWGEIKSIHLFPDSQTIVEVIFMPTASYDLVVEETVAYAITMIALLLTAMLIGDIQDVRSEKLTRQNILAKDFGACYSQGDEEQALKRLNGLLGITGA